MLKIYKTSANIKEIEELEEITQDSWIDLTNPTEKEFKKATSKG